MSMFQPSAPPVSDRGSGYPHQWYRLAVAFLLTISIVALLLALINADGRLVAGSQVPVATVPVAASTPPPLILDGASPRSETLAAFSLPTSRRITPATAPVSSPAIATHSPSALASTALPVTSTPTASTAWLMGQRPFTSWSTWNTPISSSARYTRLPWPAPGYPDAMYWVNWEAYSPAIYVAKPWYPWVKVSIPATWNWPAQVISVQVPVGVTGAAGSDGEILVINGDTVHNFWQFKRSSTTRASASSYGRTSLTWGSGWGSKVTGRSAGIVAAGASQLAGLLVKAETDAGEIRHALQLGIAANLHLPGYTGQALGGDGTASQGISRTGQRLAIPRWIAMPSGLSPLGQKVFRALRDYGAFDIDTGGAGTTLLRAQANAYDSTIMNSLRQDMPRLLPLLHRVD